MTLTKKTFVNRYPRKNNFYVPVLVSLHLTITGTWYPIKKYRTLWKCNLIFPFIHLTPFSIPRLLVKGVSRLSSLRSTMGSTTTLSSSCLWVVVVLSV